MALDINAEKVKMLNKKFSPFEDQEISKYLKTKELNFRVTLNKNDAYENSNYIIISTLTDIFNIDN